MTGSNQKVLVAGASGYLGRKLIEAYAQAGYEVRALVRNPDKLQGLEPFLDDVFVGEATRSASLKGCCDGVGLVISALGITRQKDGLTYDQVDYGANHNLLNEALRAQIDHFAYIHVLKAEAMPNVAMARAKARFAAELSASSLNSTLICPSGFYSDLIEVLHMAETGRVYLFGDGESRISPIDGEDLAKLCVEATTNQVARLEIGGPETFTQNDIAALAFQALGREPKIVHIPLWAGRALTAFSKMLGMKSVAGPLEFFLSASSMDMSAPNGGQRKLLDAFKAELASKA